MSTSRFELSRLAIPAVSLLISFLSYSSQYLFLSFPPEPLSSQETWKFNVLVACIWISYYRACTVDPGRVPKDWKPASLSDVDNDATRKDVFARQRWCRKCEAFKPPRAHHCKKCARCIPKMDHHCPWTNNCVSHFTFPHFVRFLFYAVVSMIYLESFLWTRAAYLWENRSLPSYLGPSVFQLAHFFVLILVNTFTLIALSLLLIRTLWSLGANVTTIESWEIERHRTLLRRARYFGGYLDGPDGLKVRIQKQEFPYDIGIFKNIKAGMGGSSNILSWFWPFSATPDRSTGLDFEINEFADPDLSWPPPDPDRIPRKPRIRDPESPFHVPHYDDPEKEIQAFRARQEADLQRQRGGYFPGNAEMIQRRRKFHERFRDTTYVDDCAESEDATDENKNIAFDEGEESWRNKDGERLEDFGVDEVAEFYDDDDVPLAALMQRLKERQE
ncbi:hypothetical protein VTN49DRAFT_3197 [Thermomyces lanuginosus]|uniref:uncharacterized protein n=1 Tax=Thermomyces lanuginosus TaxID=5541 RepID=UPI00374258ED